MKRRQIHFTEITGLTQITNRSEDFDESVANVMAVTIGLMDNTRNDSNDKDLPDFLL
jgi:hypothetical protein